MSKPVAAAQFLLLLAISFFMSAKAYAYVTEGLGRLELGDLEILIIRDADVTMEKDLLPDLNKHPEYEAVFEKGPVEAVDQVFFLKNGDHKILIDSGWGDANKVKGNTQNILKGEGIKAEEITDVIMTHLDHDHSGGLLKNGVASFPNARLWISKPEYEAWSSGKLEKRPQAAIDMNKKIFDLYKDRLNIFNFEEEILPGITALDASGHTPGHTAYQIKSGDNELLIVGDMIHIAPVQLPLPELSTVYDIDMFKAAQTREKMLNKAAESGATLAGMHFPMISKVLKRSDHGYMMREPR